MGWLVEGRAGIVRTRHLSMLWHCWYVVTVLANYARRVIIRKYERHVYDL